MSRLMADIHHILSRYPTDCRPARIEPLGSAGGMSGAAFWRLATPRGRLALRRWPAKHPTPERLRFLHAVLQHAQRRGIDFLPVPIATTDGETFVVHAGHRWELAPWLQGAADYQRSPSVEKLRAALTALAQFHVATADFSFPTTSTVSVGRQTESPPQTITPIHSARAPAPAITRRLARLRELTPAAVADLSRAVTDITWPDLAPLASQFLAALPHAVPHALAQLEPLADVPLPLQVCIRDIWHDHVLFIGERVTGLIDFGATDFDTPATDIARLLGSLAEGVVPFLPDERTDDPLHSGQHRAKAAKRGLSPSPADEAPLWREGLAAYSAVRPLTPQESLAVFAINTATTLLAGCNWIRWIYIEGRQFDNHEQVIERFRRIAARTEWISQADDLSSDDQRRAVGLE